MALNLTIEILLYVIIYPLAIELFAIQNHRRAAPFTREFRSEKDGPPQIEIGVAKTFSITIMRLPRWKRRLPEAKR
jgi:hypothetical protein